MRSAIALGIGLLIAATAPGLHAQRLGSSNGNTASDQAGQTAQQPAKPGTPTTAKPGTASPAKPAAQSPAKPASQTPAKPAAQAPAKPTAQTPAKPAPAAAAKPAPQAGKPAATATAKPAVAQAKPAAKPAGQPGKKRGAVKPAKPPVEKAAGPADAPKAAAESEVKAARRDPFESMLAHSQSGKANPNLPPGKAGLQVSTLRLDGIVRAPNGMIAVVSNPQSRTYFLREGDHLYDGSVDKITMDGVSFHEEGKDAFGKPVERQVNKRIYSTSSGEQQ
jgi:Tfp pilus assembly protein PilP